MSDNISSAERKMKQKAVYWAKTGDDIGGDPIYANPVEIKCRWEDVHEQFVDAHGKDAVSNSKLLVDRDVTIDGQLWLGELKNLDSFIPTENDGAYAIRKLEKIPNSRATKFLRIVML